MGIVIENLNFGYTPEKNVLSDINMKIEEPGLYCIIGPNGVGKSTLVRCISKLLQPTSGKILINDKNINEYTIKEMSSVLTYVPIPSASAFPMTVMDTVLLGRHNKHRWKTNDKDILKVNKALKIFGIEDLATRNSNELSAGQYQSVSLARGLVQETKILVLDEPTSNLDIRHQVYVTELFRELSIACGMIIIMISHDLNIASKYADEIILMSEPGIVYKTGSPNEIITSDNIEFVYGVTCKVLSDFNRPLVSLGSALSDDEIRARRHLSENLLK
ncbi:ABC transporter ATP-binding protein [Candidatus Methanomassiliicoccus intestinalis]|uniref:ABC transporter ATP-binding protein n=1 Tax=Candidatus Methanomassiliicoccus intestinalis TaxID=1406512 RepID=UPI0037DC814D